MRGRLAILLGTLTLALAGEAAAEPVPAHAFDLAKAGCTVAGLLSRLAGTLCTAARRPGEVLQAGKKLLGGHLGGALETLSGSGTAVRAVTAGTVLAAIVAWVTGGAQAALETTAGVISSTTRPQLQSTWFSASYWRMAAIAALLTLPFLFAASLQALMRSDLTLLARSAFGYLPLGVLAVSIAAPVTMLLLSASDELSTVIAGATGSAPGAALSKFGMFAGTLGLISRSTFIVFFIGLLTVAATIILWAELLIRAAAVYVVVLMLPLFFAALVWPARRVWAVRAVELLVALILSKFAIVAVLSLGAAAVGQSVQSGVAAGLAGATLVMLAACSPWALMRLLPLHELTGSLEGLRTRGSPFPLGNAEAATERAAEIGQAVMLELPAGSSAPAGTQSSAAATAIQGLAHPTPEPTDRIAASQAPAGATRPSGPPDQYATSPEPGVGSEGPAPADARAGEPPLSTAVAAGGAAEPTRERQPGMDARWQTDNWSDPPLVFGPESMPEERAPDAPALPEEQGAAQPPPDHGLRHPGQAPNGGPL